jgi:hypothetical protein
MWKLLPEAYTAARKASNRKRRATHGGTSKLTCESPSIQYNVLLTDLHSSIPCRSSKITFRVLRDSIYGDKCLGRCDMDVEELLERRSQEADGGKCHHFVNKSYYDSHLNNLDVVLSLADERGNPSTGRLTVQIAHQSMPDVAGDNVEHARTAAQKRSSPPIVNAVDGVTDSAGTVSNQMGLVTSLGSLLGKVEILVKIGDEVAKVCLCCVRAHRTVLK